MPGIRGVVSTLTPDGEEVLGPDILMWHYPSNDIINGSLLTVESNHFCVLKSRGAILSVYETGQYQVQTPQKILFGSIQQAFYGGQSPWQYEALYINRAKLVIHDSGKALSREMAQLSYDIDYYVNIATAQNAVTLVQHMPYRGHYLTVKDVNFYAGPVVEQAINQIVQVTPLERVNERIHEITQLVHNHLQEFLAVYGITLDTVKVLVYPSDERMKSLISLKAFGLSELDAIRYYTAMLMAERGTVSAPNMAVGQPFYIGGTTPTVNADRFISAPPVTGAPTVPAPRPPAQAANTTPTPPWPGFDGGPR
ncbi:MAG TPA: SPFH domain-containing protein [Chloroflexia bacterium]|nr:SPFH domain-containing protein [Chloroflexia bacterium]